MEPQEVKIFAWNYSARKWQSWSLTLEVQLQKPASSEQSFHTWVALLTFTKISEVWLYRFYFSFTSSFYYLTLIHPFCELCLLHLCLLDDSPMPYCLLSEQRPLFSSTNAISQPPGSHPSHDCTAPSTTSTPSLSNTCILINPGLSLILFISIHTDHCPIPYIIIYPGHSLTSFIPFLSGTPKSPVSLSILVTPQAPVSDKHKLLLSLLSSLMPVVP